MQTTLTFLIMTMLTATANAYWVKDVVTSKPMYLMCSSNTGTDGDLLFEVPIQVDLVESRWAGLTTFEGSAEVYTSFELVIDAKLKTAYFGDVTDVSPLSEESVKLSRTAFSDQYDLTLALGYRIVIPTTVQNVADPIVTADSYQNEIGVSQCQLVESTYNSLIE